MVSLRRITPILALAAAVLLAGCGGGGKHAETIAPVTTTTTAAKPATTKPATPKAKTASDGAILEPGVKPITTPAERRPLDPRRTYQVVVKTSEGNFTIRLDQKQSPHAAASFAALARKGYFNDTIFHRIVPGFLIQGGDRTGTGTGDPGYIVVDRPPAHTKYTRGTVAMAKRQGEPAGSAGSQFFIVTKQRLFLPALYAVLGHVASGLAVVQKIGKLGDVNTEKPSKQVVILHATVQEAR
jgi:peptidyl-prolyl cis-trans isomerase B (cyclophilin B)